MSHKVLFVDDESRVVEGYRRKLRRHIDMDIACSGSEGLKLIEANGPYAVVVSDMRMPGMDGLEFLSKVKELVPSTVRVMLTGNSDQKTAIDAVNKGRIFRFLSKPCETESVISVLNDGIQEYERNVDENDRLETALNDVENLSNLLSHQANHDALTNLANREEFQRQLNLFLQSSDRNLNEASLCYLNVDQLKLINDGCGRTAGDELLRFVSRILKHQLRKNELLARVVGDEFGILLRDCEITGAAQVAENVRDAISRQPFVWDGEKFFVTVRIGIIPITDEIQSAEQLLSAADSACWTAKEMGGDRVHISQSDDENFSKRKGELKWIGEINSALQENRFCLLYQTIAPITNKKHGHHYEFLIRMKDQEGKLIPPGLFLPTAEKYNLCEKIDRWVIREAFQWLSKHPQHTDNLHLCSINLSGHSLGSSEIFEFVTGEFERSRLPRTKICFEITETATISNFSSAITFIKEFKKTGCLFALDDFGSGLSSFGYLKNLPVDFLKIDGEFVKEIDKNQKDFAMVKSINEVGHIMGIETIAEFVENNSILNKLTEIGVDYAQGYGIAMPSPVEQLISQENIE